MHTSVNAHAVWLAFAWIDSSMLREKGNFIRWMSKLILIFLFERWKVSKKFILKMFWYFTNLNNINMVDSLRISEIYSDIFRKALYVFLTHHYKSYCIIQINNNYEFVRYLPVIRSMLLYYVGHFHKFVKRVEMIWKNK